jgi:DNA processing protein
MSEIRIITPDSDEWPAGLNDLGKNMPAQLWALGQPIPKGPSVAVVGARACTSYGEHVTQSLVSGLPQGTVVISGAAYGIDAAAHRTALNAGLSTVAYLAGGVDRPYPAGHRDLIGRIAQHGTVLSEVEPGSAPTRWRFLQRNRLIAAHAQALVVVEAGWRSGSLNAASHATFLHRPVGAVPGPVTSPASAGTNRLIEDYDARVITSTEDIGLLLRNDPRGVRRG